MGTHMEGRDGVPKVLVRENKGRKFISLWVVLHYQRPNSILCLVHVLGVHGPFKYTSKQLAVCFIYGLTFECEGRLHTM